MSEKQPHEIAFEQARARMRITGAGGITLPNGQTSERHIPKQDPSKHLKVGRDGVVYIGGPNVKTTTRRESGSVRIIDLGRKASIQKDKAR